MCACCWQHCQGAWLQAEALKNHKPIMVVGTPGRLAELSLAGKLLMHPTGVLVLDEVSRLTMKQCGSSKCTSSNSSAQNGPHSSNCTSSKSSAQAVPPSFLLSSRGAVSPVPPVPLPAWFVHALGFMDCVGFASQVAGIKAELATCWCTICGKLTVLRIIWLPA